MKQAGSKSMFKAVIAFALFTLYFVVASPVASVKAGSATGPLPISGDFEWARSMGGTGFDAGKGIAVDTVGNIYATGSFQGSVDFDPGAGDYTLTSLGTHDIFISKLDSNGNFVWAKNLGVAGASQSSGGIALDSNGNVYTTGYFSGTVDFDPGVGIFNLTDGGAFVSKLNSDGDFVWAKRLGGAETYGNSIAVDSSGNVHTTGAYGRTADFDPGDGVFDLVNITGIPFAYISKLDVNGNFVWAKSLPLAEPFLPGSVTGYSIAVDSKGNVYTTGRFAGTCDFDPGTVAFDLTASGVDIYISKLDADGNFAWAKQMGATGDDYGYDITVDSNDVIYATGSIEEEVTLPASESSSQGTTCCPPPPIPPNDIILFKIASNGNLIWTRTMGGTSDDSGVGITVDPVGNVYTTGHFAGTADFDPGTGTYNLSTNNDYIHNTFVSKLDKNGNFVWAKSMSGGASTDQGNDITLDLSGRVHTIGHFSLEVDFDPGPGVTNLTSAGGTDIFISTLQADLFMDVTDTYWANSYITSLYNAGITGGCSTLPLLYCPETSVTRAQMAVFLLRGEHGSTYNPPDATGAVFGDVPLGHWAGAWIEQLAAEGITGGCGNGNYCPDMPVTRDQMAVFLLRAEHGSAYTPPTPTGVFTDVPTDHWAAAWIEQLAAEGITGGCSASPMMYCPATVVNRAQMAVFLVRAFNLP